MNTDPSPEQPDSNADKSPSSQDPKPIDTSAFVSDLVESIVRHCADGQKNYQEECNRKINEFEKTEVKCGLIGPSGTGKSSLINAIVGYKVSEVGTVETTMEAKSVSHNGLIFTDLPGCGTKNFPKDKYVTEFELLEYDCLILVTSTRFTENDAFLYQELSSRGKSCFVVRNKFDEAVMNEREDNDRDEDQTYDLITCNIRKNLAPSSPDKIYLISAKMPTKYDFERLTEGIAESLDGLKMERFVNDIAAYSKIGLKRKRQIAIDRVSYYAGLAAMNGLNLSSDISESTGILLEMGNAVAKIYGLTPGQCRFTERLLRGAMPTALTNKVALFANHYVMKEGIALLLKALKNSPLINDFSRYMPLVGRVVAPIIASKIGWHVAFRFGEQLVNEAEEIASEIVDALVAKSTTRPE